MRELNVLLKEFEWVRMMMIFLVLVIVLHLWCLPLRGLPPSDLRIALNLLSLSFPLSLFYCIQQAFVPAATRHGCLFGFVSCNHLFSAPLPDLKNLRWCFFSPRFFIIHFICWFMILSFYSKSSTSSYQVLTQVLRQVLIQVLDRYIIIFFTSTICLLIIDQGYFNIFSSDKSSTCDFHLPSISQAQSTGNLSEFSLYHEVIIQVLQKFSFINREKMSQYFTWEPKKCIHLWIESLWRRCSFLSLELILNILFRKLLDLILGERHTNLFLRFSTNNENSELLSMIWITCWFSFKYTDNICDCFFIIGQLTCIILENDLHIIGRWCVEEN